MTLVKNFYCAVCNIGFDTAPEFDRHLCQRKPEGTRFFESGATRDMDYSKLDYEGFLSPSVLHRFAEYMHECRLRNIPQGQAVRSSDNWQKGIPLDAYMKSLLRHVMEIWRIHRHGQSNQKLLEDTLCAVMFNAMGYLYEQLTREHERTDSADRCAEPGCCA